MTNNGKLIKINENEFKYGQDFNAFTYYNGPFYKGIINLSNGLILIFAGNNKYSLWKYNEIEIKLEIQDYIELEDNFSNWAYLWN